MHLLDHHDQDIHFNKQRPEIDFFQGLIKIFYLNKELHDWCCI